jgi:hypothetical protein
MNTTLYDKAVNMAATHFMSLVPEDATAKEIFDALSQEDLPDGYSFCLKICTDPDDLADMIEILADDFIAFHRIALKSVDKQ